MSVVGAAVKSSINCAAGQPMLEMILDKGNKNETSKTNDCNERWNSLLS